MQPLQRTDRSCIEVAANYRKQNAERVQQRISPINNGLNNLRQMKQMCYPPIPPHTGKDGFGQEGSFRQLDSTSPVFPNKMNDFSSTLFNQNGHQNRGNHFSGGPRNANNSSPNFEIDRQIEAKWKSIETIVNYIGQKLRNNPDGLPPSKNPPPLHKLSREQVDNFDIFKRMLDEYATIFLKALCYPLY